VLVGYRRIEAVTWLPCRPGRKQGLQSLGIAPFEAPLLGLHWAKTAFAIVGGWKAKPIPPGIVPRCPSGRPCPFH